MLFRMKYIDRWALMRNSRRETLTEHTLEVAVLAHALALIRRNILHLDGPDPDRCAVAALYHDASEILTGDLPTPIKYYNGEMKQAYKQVEHIAGEKLLGLIPEALRASYESHIHESDKEVDAIVKAADKLAAHIKCLEEQKAGNREFDNAAAQTYDAMVTMDRPELQWFLQNCLPAFSRSLDELGL